jgi:alpha-1,3-rhamnosyl/mannosyltransferase
LVRFLIDLTMCFAKGQTVFHGGGEYGKEAARFLAASLREHEVLALIREGTAGAVAAELGPEVALREVADGPMRQLPPDLNDPADTLFLPLGGKFLKAQGGAARPRVVMVEHDLRAFDAAHGISDRLCHPLLPPFWRRLACVYAALRRRKRVTWATRKARLRYDALRADDRVVAPSRYTKYAVYLNLDRIAPGREAHFRDRLELLPPLSPFVGEVAADEGGGERRGILMLGANRAVKNADRFLEGLRRHPPAREAANHEGIDLVGADAGVAEAFQRRHGAELTLRCHPYVEAGRLEALIGGARLLAYPSLAEGYGIPPVEAFRLGTPVLAGAVTAVPEVVGGAALLADPLDGSEMANKTLQVLDDAELWQAKSKQGRDRFRELRANTLRRWERFAREMDRAEVEEMP